MDIIRGKIPCAKKVVIYGPEGIGKSTFAAQFPEPLFIDTEGSTKEMDVARTPKPSSWTMLREQVSYVIANPTICKTLVIDTIDWAEQMCVEDICARHQKNGVEDFGYGNGYVYVKEEFGRLLNQLEEVVAKGVHVVLAAHSQMRKFEQPDEMGAYDRYELKLGKKTSSQTSPLVKEWADMLLFCNYKTYSIATDDKGKKHKAQGGKRVMYTAHHPCWDAKNRYGLADELPFDYTEIAGIIEPAGGKQEKAAPKQQTAKQAPAQPVTPPAEPIRETPSEKQEIPDAGKANQPPQAETEPPAPREPDAGAGQPHDSPGQPDDALKLDEAIPKALRDLMLENKVGEWDIQLVVSAKGYYPSDVPISKYDPGFINGVLVGAWPKVYAMIQEMKDKLEIPFNN